MPEGDTADDFVDSGASFCEAPPGNGAAQTAAQQKAIRLEGLGPESAFTGAVVVSAGRAAGSATVSGVAARAEGQKLAASSRTNAVQ